MKYGKSWKYKLCSDYCLVVLMAVSADSSNMNFLLVWVRDLASQSANLRYRHVHAYTGSDILDHWWYTNHTIPTMILYRPWYTERTNIPTMIYRPWYTDPNDIPIRTIYTDHDIPTMTLPAYDIPIRTIYTIPYYTDHDIPASDIPNALIYTDHDYTDHDIPALIYRTHEYRS